MFSCHLWRFPKRIWQYWFNTYCGRREYWSTWESWNVWTVIEVWILAGTRELFVATTCPSLAAHHLCQTGEVGHWSMSEVSPIVQLNFRVLMEEPCIYKYCLSEGGYPAAINRLPSVLILFLLPLVFMFWLARDFGRGDVRSCEVILWLVDS